MRLSELNNDVLDIIGNYVNRDNEKRLKEERLIQILFNQYSLRLENLLIQYK